MAPKLRRAALLASLLAAGSATAVTLTVTPDKSTYLVGETITLTVSGDPGTAMDGTIFGRLLFDPAFAVFEGAEQTALTSFGGLSWIVSGLSAGSGFADAFNQVVGSPRPADCCLMAEVRLRATAAGALGYSWNTSGTFVFDFFGLTTAPGGGVTIVPEPATGLLLALGLAATALYTGRSRRSKRDSRR